MTALGKTLTVFIFLLSLAWCWLTVNAYVTRTNWQTQAKVWETHAKSAAQRASELEGAYNALKASNETQVAELLKSISSQKDKLTNLELNIAKLNANFEQLSLDNKKAEDAKTAIAKNLEATNKQLDSAKEARDAIESRFVTAQRSEQDARNNALAMKLETESFRLRNEQLEVQLLQLQSQLNDLRQGRSGLGPTPIVPVPTGIRASVASVTGDLVTITLGADAGLLKGAMLDITRSNPTRYLGQIRISDVEPKRAVGVFLPAGGGRVTLDNIPKAGDSVEVIR